MRIFFIDLMKMPLPGMILSTRFVQIFLEQVDNSWVPDSKINRSKHDGRSEKAIG